MLALVLAFAGVVAAQSIISTSAGLPNASGLAPCADGFGSPYVHLSRGGSAVCVSGTFSVAANTTKNVKFDFQILQNQSGVFFYDRLGVGKSEKPDPLDVVQALLEVEIANNLAQKLSNGAFGGVRFEKDVGVGHSFGSIITQAITSQ